MLDSEKVMEHADLDRDVCATWSFACALTARGRQQHSIRVTQYSGALTVPRAAEMVHTIGSQESGRYLDKSLLIPSTSTTLENSQTLRSARNPAFKKDGTESM